MINESRISQLHGTPDALAAAEEARLRAELHHSEQRFRNTFDCASIGMALVALNGQWLEVNRALCDLVGYSAEELACHRFSVYNASGRP